MKKVAIITGADGGMGQEHTKAVAEAGYEVVMACRDLSRATKICQELTDKYNYAICVFKLDLASFRAIHDFVDNIKNQYSHIDLLLNNAGVLCHSPEVTADGIENTVGVNYLGHYYLTNQLMPLMPAGARIVNMVSLTYRYGKITDSMFNPLDEKHFNRFSTYSNSKLALLYFTLDAAERWNDLGITVNCADPGIVSTNIIRMGNVVIDKLCDWFFRPIIRKPRKGAETMLYLALSPDLTVTGGCFASKKQISLSSKLTESPQRQQLKKQTDILVSEITEKLNLC